MKSKEIAILFLLIFFINCDTYDICFATFESYAKFNCQISSPNITHFCVYSDGKCKSQSIIFGCKNYKGKDESICESAIPDISDRFNYECKMVDGVCTEVLKKCNEYEINLSECSNLDAGGDNKRCIINNNKCESHYNNCNFEEANKESCEANIPLNTLHECVWENNTCQEKPKLCEGNEYSCLSFRVSDPENKECVNFNSECKEQYKTCEIYNEKVSNKNKEECESLKINDGTIYRRYNNRCIFNEKTNTCSTGTKCSDFTYAAGCNAFIPSDSDKRCSFQNGICKEIYKACELYDKKTPSELKNEADCKENREYDNFGNFYYYSKCVYENNTCIRQRITKCEDYDEIGISYCSMAYISYFKYCKINDGKCVEDYRHCPEKEEEISKEKCEAIIPYNDDQFKCVYNEEDKGCYGVLKQCSDGTNEETCKSMVLYKQNELGLYYKKTSSKCVWENKSCVEKAKECWEAINPRECLSITPTNTYKMCFYLYGECKEVYKDCEAYNNNGKEEIIKSVCESIFFQYPTIKCVFKSGNPNQCVQENVTSCSEFNKDDYGYHCELISLNSISDKCVYSNSVCSTQKKTCLELKKESGVDKKICESAVISGSNKYCALKEDESGCEEKEKENKSTFGLSVKKLWFNLLVILLGLIL